MRLDRHQRISVGRLGTFDFAPGYFLYFGSARAGLKSRIERHQRREKTLHWHIDYLLRRACIEIVETHETDHRSECDLHERTLDLPGATIPVPGFGAGDCRCRSHLIYLDES